MQYKYFLHMILRIQQTILTELKSGLLHPSADLETPQRGLLCMQVDFMLSWSSYCHDDHYHHHHYHDHHYHGHHYHYAVETQARLRSPLQNIHDGRSGFFLKLNCFCEINAFFCVNFMNIGRRCFKGQRKSFIQQRLSLNGIFVHISANE